MADSEFEELRRQVDTFRNDLITQLGGYVGLLAFEIPQIYLTQINRTNGEHCRLRVPEGKDTSGGGGKPRDAYPLLISRRISTGPPPRKTFTYISKMNQRDSY